MILKVAERTLLHIDKLEGKVREAISHSKINTNSVNVYFEKFNYGEHEQSYELPEVVAALDEAGDEQISMKIVVKTNVLSAWQLKKKEEEIVDGLLTFLSGQKSNMVKAGKKLRISCSET
jgi:hypothetical protein